MFWKSLDGIIADKDSLREEMSEAFSVGGVYLGKEHLIHKRVLSSRYLSYSSVARMFLRIDSGEYGDIQLDQYILVVEDKNGIEQTIHAERRLVVDRILEWISKNHPEICIGKKYN